MTEHGTPPTFWKTVWLLLGISRRRAVNRARRQQELLNSRTGRQATNWNPIFFLMGLLLMAAINLLAAVVLKRAMEASRAVETTWRVERISEVGGGGGDKILVSQQFLDAVIAHENNQRLGWKGVERFPPDYTSEAKRIVRETGGSQSAIEQRLRGIVQNHRLNDLLTRDELRSGRQVRLLVTPNSTGEASEEASAQSSFKVPVATGRFPTFVGSLILFLWVSMLVCQGEGLELDMQRRRHPMWEWLYSHPVPTGAIFFAEMLSPIAANPLYWSAPLFAGFTYGFNYGPGIGLLATVVIGVPISIAAACLGKALEIGIILRFSPRARGGIVGLMSWVGYATMMVFLLGLALTPAMVGALGRLYNIVIRVPWPWLGLFLGVHADGSHFFLSGFLVCWAAAAVTISGSVWFSVWGAKRGLSGNYGQADSRPSKAGQRVPRFGKEPLYRKEFLWFIRDRSAIVQTILIPLTVAGYQAFNFRFLLAHAQGAWNYLCGTAILFGTYFLWVLGPKSLASEGQALWIALTWPRGLENLLKAKAWLWSMISSGLVAIILGYAVFLFPHSAWKIALVGIGWFFFGRSMAEKSVTLVTVTSESGEVQKVPRGRYWATQLGMLTFAIGVITQQWSLAIVGIVYSYITAAAMWQNFRARLPYLYDPWSERVPPPPTLMHSMIGISILVEGVAVFTAVFVGFLGASNLGIAQAFAYGLCAIAVSVGMSSFLDGRSVSSQQIWCWEPGKVVSDTDPYEAQPLWRSQRLFDAGFLPWLMAGAAGGLLLGLFALGYVAVLMHIPGIAEPLRKSRELMVSQPALHISYAIMAVFFAPFAEEYLFRGLLFRALDREWGGWRAVVGSAAFFAIYHPPTSWLPVGLLGAANAILFKKSGRLAPAILLHMLYNAVVSIG